MRSSPVSASPAAQPSVADFVRHRGPVTSVAGVPGRRAAISGGYDSAVAWVDLDAGTFDLLGYHEHLVNAVVVEADGRRAASCSSDYTVCLWDLESRRPIRVLRGHADDVNDFVFLDERRGASVSHDQRVYVWDLETGAVLRVLEGHQKYAMSVDAAGGKIYSSGDDMTLRQWDADSGEALRVWGPFEVETDTCAIDRRHGRVVLGADDGCVRVFDAAGGELVREIQAHDSGIKKVAVSPATGAILSAGYDQRLLVWDPESFVRRATLESGQTTWERSLSWSPDGTEILAGTFDGTVVTWDVQSGRRGSEIDGGVAGGNVCYNDVAAAADGTLTLVADDGLVRLARVGPEERRGDGSGDGSEGGPEAGSEGGHILDAVEPASGRVLMNGVAFDAELGVVATGAHDGKLHLFRRVGDRLRGEVEVQLDEGPINCIEISHHAASTGDLFVGCYSGTVVRVGPQGEIRARFHFNDGAVKALVLHPQREVGVSAGADGGAASWTFGGELLENFPGHVAIADDVDLDPSGERVATVSRDFTLKVYDLATGKLLASRSLGQRSPKSVSFWDRETVVVGNYWGALLRYDLAAGGGEVRTIAANGISGLARAGDHLAATSYDGAVYLVRPSDLEVVAILRSMVQKVAEPVVRTL